MSPKSEVEVRKLAVKGIIFNLNDEERALFDAAYTAVRDVQEAHPEAFELALSLIILEVADES